MKVRLMTKVSAATSFQQLPAAYSRDVPKKTYTIPNVEKQN